MIIELRGVEFHNKGAELMLVAILDKFKKSFPNAIFVMETRNTVSVSNIRKVGIRKKFRYKKRGIDLSFLGTFIPKSVRHRKGLVLESEIDVIFDGSGFAFGDIWGANKAKTRLSGQIKKWKSDGKKIIVLPQAFGPFKNSELRIEMQKIVEYANVIFARDIYSYNYLMELNVTGKEKIIRKPDFTNLLEGVCPSYFLNRKKHIGIIPNYKMIETNVFESETKYIELLLKLVKFIKDDGYTPYFLNHEGKKDLNLIQKANSQLDSEIEVIDEDNALFIKGIINSSSAIITSRFHGLVSALSQATPCLCIGWSHKYQALMEEYNYIEGLIRNEELDDLNLKGKINSLTENSSRAQITNILERASMVQKRDTENMWERVFDEIMEI